MKLLLFSIVLANLGVISGKRVASSVKLLYLPKFDFPSSISATKYCQGIFEKPPLEGDSTLINCKPGICLESEANCEVTEQGADNEFYKPGCCVGDDEGCTNSTRCGERCMFPPDSCFLTDTGSTDPCLQSDCYTCPTDGGKSIYTLGDQHTTNVCFSNGVALTESGDPYNWAIICSKHTQDFPGAEEQNRGVGEIECLAARDGAGFTDKNEGILSGSYPCQFIQLIECGCGPLDMNDFGFGAPKKPCGPGDCAILCDDQPDSVPVLCDNFQQIGGIKWWEGDNPFDSTLFYTDLFVEDGTFEYSFTVNNCARTFWTDIPLIGWLFGLIFGLFDYVFG